MNETWLSTDLLFIFEHPFVRFLYKVPDISLIYKRPQSKKKEKNQRALRQPDAVHHLSGESVMST